MLDGELFLGQVMSEPGAGLFQSGVNDIVAATHKLSELAHGDKFEGDRCRIDQLLDAVIRMPGIQAPGVGHPNYVPG